ncbi:MAG TPA: bifunctional alpha,alpha-trehalose-phosphate synthase (UDP-forming)/trehalose-phosphatase [bacterium]|nr:bifunctional alpha,alpha-trehalose-phosphate synthase (UDP-forming)/trehalose-phosphatase [bacterium]
MHGHGGLPNRLRGVLADRPLIVVSNREPYTHRRSGGAAKVERPVGGLTAALDPVMQDLSGTWIAWGDGDADFDDVAAGGRVPVPPEAPRYTLKRIALPHPEVEGYYYGYANQALWPLCHMAMSQARFRARYWAAYQSVNARFAAAVREEAGREALVWIHDYHLALCPRELRRTRPDLFLMHFWHIPWPAWDVFRICPQGAELLDGLLANDLIGFQHPRHVEHFLECAEREIGARVEDGIVEYKGRVTHVEAFPISVDAAALDQLARSRSCERWMARLRRRFALEGRTVAVSVDRLDYTKGIPERLKAIDLFFKRRPEYRTRVVFIQKTAPSRTRIKAYRDLESQVEEAIAHLNAAYAVEGWQPVISLPQPLPPAGMAALYRMADLCVVSSLQDGMNLVAKEFVACQVDRRGVLALSELAGARDELSWAIPINPYDVEGCADALARAIEMPVLERRRRLDRLRTDVAEHDITHWVDQHLEAAAHLLGARSATRQLFDAAGRIDPTVGRGRPLALLMDFDGTLTGFADDPDSVRIPPRIQAALARIARAPDTFVAIISGRALDDIRLRAGIDGIVYGGNHGLEIAGPGWTWTVPKAEEARGAIGPCCVRLRARLRGVPGVWVEDKGLTASVHYRRSPHRHVEQVRMAVLEELAQLSPRTLGVRQGKHVLELRPDISWDKGAAVRWVLTRALGDDWAATASVVYLGDDRTDEDAFEALAAPAVTVKVGPNAHPTAARYAVRNIDEVYRFIETIDARRAALSVPAGAAAGGAGG